jgi:hypothetical protein
MASRKIDARRILAALPLAHIIEADKPKNGKGKPLTRGKRGRLSTPSDDIAELLEDGERLIEHDLAAFDSLIDLLAETGRVTPDAVRGLKAAGLLVATATAQTAGLVATLMQKTVDSHRARVAEDVDGWAGIIKQIDAAPGKNLKERVAHVHREANRPETLASFKALYHRWKKRLSS